MIDRRIKFRHIQCFVEIAREGSFKNAAAKLYLTQPAISKTLKELEDILGTELLHRSRAGVQLTSNGERFLHFAQMSLASLQQGITGMSEQEGLHRETLSVGVLPSVAARLIPEVAAHFEAQTPDVILRIVDGPHGYLLDRLKLGDVSLVLGRMSEHSKMKGISFSTLYRERISFVVRAGHPILNNPMLEDLPNWPVVFPPLGSAIRPIADRFLVEQGIGPIPHRIETVSGAFGRRFVRNSDAIWVISEGVVANELAEGRLTALPYNTDTTLGPIGIMSREDWDYTPAAKTLRRILHEVIDARGGLDA